MRKGLEILAVILTSVVLLAGTGFGLCYFNIIETPYFLSYIPVAGSLLIKQDVAMEPVITDLEKLKAENEHLKNTIAQKQKEINKLQEHISQIAKEKEITEAVEHNQEVAKTPNSKAAYKDMAGYIAEMKSQDAAEILSRLKDEEIIGIFSELSKDVVAEMLQKMDRGKAASLTQKMLVTDS